MKTTHTPNNFGKGGRVVPTNIDVPCPWYVPSETKGDQMCLIMST